MTTIPSQPSTPFTSVQRRRLLDEYFSLLPDVEAEGETYTHAIARLSDLWDAYIDGTPFVPVARCPFTGGIFSPSIDNMGLDGLFWKYDAAARRYEPMVDTRFAFTGAVLLAESVEPTPFLVKPGPEAPFVVPRMLSHPELRAVLSTVPIGRHTGYAITYFSKEPLMELERFNTWGLSDYSLVSDDGEYGWSSSSPTLLDFDFDLAPWIQSGKLLWITPGDEAWLLREGLADCPYLNLPGRHLPLCIQGGEAWATTLWDGKIPDDEPAPATEAPAPQTLSCPNCRVDNDPDAKFCCDCGTPLKLDVPVPVICRSCGKLLKQSAQFCSECGAKQT